MIHKKSALKTIIYRLYQSFIISPIIVYILTGNVAIAFSFSVIEVLTKIPSYYIFERLWERFYGSV